VEHLISGSTSSRTPLVGRDRELSILLDALEAAARGSSAILLLSGEPGVGKTRLIVELTDRAKAAAWSVLVGHAYDSEGMPPYLPFIEALSDYVRSMSMTDLMAQLGDTVGQLALLLPDVRRHFHDQDTRGATDPESRRYELFEGISDFLGSIARSGRQGLLLCLDDLHWADDSTLLLLEHILHRSHDERLVVLVSYRETELDISRPLARTLAQITRQRIARRVDLRRLAKEDVRSLLAALGQPSPPETIVDAVFRETEGNPFFVHEVFEYLAEDGRLFDADGQWRTDLHISEFDVPQSVRLVTGRRLERLSEKCRRMLGEAAVLGRTFSFELLQAISELDESALLDALDEATAAGLVSSARERQSFTHELIRQTLLGSITLPRRQRLSLRAATALIELYGSEDPEHLNDIVAHYRVAGAAAEPGVAIGFFAKAGRAAEAVFAWEDAASHYQAALDLMEASRGTRPRHGGGPPAGSDGRADADRSSEDGSRGRRATRICARRASRRSGTDGHGGPLGYRRHVPGVGSARHGSSRRTALADEGRCTHR
jgi:predicted ATPase